MTFRNQESPQLTPSRARSQEKLAANVRKLWKMTSREFGERLAAFEAWEAGERLQLAELGKRVGELEFQLAVLRAAKAVEPLRQVNEAIHAADEAERAVTAWSLTPDDGAVIAALWPARKVAFVEGYKAARRDQERCKVKR